MGMFDPRNEQIGSAFLELPTSRFARDIQRSFAAFLQDSGSNLLLFCRFTPVPSVPVSEECLFRKIGVLFRVKLRETAMYLTNMYYMIQMEHTKVNKKTHVRAV